MPGSFKFWARLASSSSLLQPLVLSDWRPFERPRVSAGPKRAPFPFFSFPARDAAAPPRASSTPFPSLAACFAQSFGSAAWSFRIFASR